MAYIYVCNSCCAHLLCAAVDGCFYDVIMYVTHNHGRLVFFELIIVFRLHINAIKIIFISLQWIYDILFLFACFWDDALLTFIDTRIQLSQKSRYHRKKVYLFQCNSKNSELKRISNCQMWKNFVLQTENEMPMWILLESFVLCDSV